jgi:hypothetical protein
MNSREPEEVTRSDGDPQEIAAGVAPAILLLSDVHAHYHVIEAQIVHAERSLHCPVAEVVVLGDFGMFRPNLYAYFRREGRRFTRPVSFLEGNHEDFGALPDLVRDYADVVVYLPRASLHRFGVWRALCLGGAKYMDAWSTPPGCEIRDAEIAACLAHPAGAVDLILTHDCPSGIGIGNTAGLEHYGPPGVAGLAELSAALQPRMWFFGHHHRWHTHTEAATRYYGLPESWLGFALLFPDGEVRCVRNEVALTPSPRWFRFFGLK